MSHVSSILRNFIYPGLSILSATVMAAEADQRPDENALHIPGWSGYVQLLAGDSSLDSLSQTAGGNERIASLLTRPNRQRSGVILPLWQLAYGLSESQTTFYLGAPDSDSIESELAIEAGVSHVLANSSRLWFSYRPGLSELAVDVWKDPFVTGMARERSKSVTDAVRFGVDYLSSRPLSIELAAGNLAVDDDRAGESLSDSLSAAEIDNLQRGADFSRISMSLALPLADHFHLIPEVSYERVLAKGDANSHGRGSFGLTAAWQPGLIKYYAQGMFGKANYRDSNPVFGVKREDDSSAVILGLGYNKRFGSKNTRLDLLFSRSQQDSNIGFYDSNSELIAAGITWLY